MRVVQRSVLAAAAAPAELFLKAPKWGSSVLKTKVLTYVLAVTKVLTNSLKFKNF